MSQTGRIFAEEEKRPMSQQPQPPPNHKSSDGVPKSTIVAALSNQLTQRWLVLLKPKVGIPLAILIVFAAVPLGIRSWRISSIPPIDEPFDVEAFCSVTIPGEENAFVEYREAFELFVEFPGKNTDWGSYKRLANGNWNEAPPAFAVWIRDNNLAYDAWLRGTAKPSGLLTPRRDLTYAAADYLSEARSLARIAMLRAGRHLSDGNTDEAWTVLHAAFRFSRHVGQNGIVIERQTGTAILPIVCSGLLAWAHHANTTAEEIENATLILWDEFTAMTPPYSMTLKHEYLAVQKCLNDLDEANWVFDQLPVIDSGLIFVLGEPEYSMHLLDLVLANQLAGIDVAPSVRPRLVSGEDRLFDISAVPRKRMSGVALAELLGQVSAIESVAEIPLIKNSFARINMERTFSSTMISALSVESYVRKHGQFPPSLDAFPELLAKELFTDPYSSSSELLIYRSNESYAVVYSIGLDGIDDSHSPNPSVEEEQNSWSQLRNSDGWFEGFRIPLSRTATDAKLDETAAGVPDNVQD
jgi:hypothetical protein